MVGTLPLQDESVTWNDTRQRNKLNQNFITTNIFTPQFSTQLIEFCNIPCAEKCAIANTF
jgi:hypothetical protein